MRRGEVEIKVLDEHGAPVENALVFCFESGRAHRLQPRLTNPERNEPTLYDWLEKHEPHERTGREGRVTVKRIGSLQGELLAFTDKLDGAMPFTASDKGPLELRLYPRRVVDVRVLGLGAKPEDEVLVGFACRTFVMHSAWTERGSVQIPLVVLQSRIALDPKMAEGEIAILLPLGKAGRVAVDFRAHFGGEIQLRLPPTAALDLECRDDSGKSIPVNGEVNLITRAETNPGSKPGSSREIPTGRGPTARRGSLDPTGKVEMDRHEGGATVSEDSADFDQSLPILGA